MVYEFGALRLQSLDHILFHRLKLHYSILADAKTQPKVSEWQHGHLTPQNTTRELNMFLQTSDSVNGTLGKVCLQCNPEASPNSSTMAKQVGISTIELCGP
jgi:hypothetical protein